MIQNVEGGMLRVRGKVSNEYCAKITRLFIEHQ
jgi:hypothetical protein